jgi:ABC-type transport system substrate-binding protein
VTDPEIDEIAKKQAVELNYEARKELIHQFQKINAKHMYYVPSQVGAGTGWRAYASRVQGGIRDTSGYGDNSEIYPYYWLSDS